MRRKIRVHIVISVNRKLRIYLLLYSESPPEGIYKRSALASSLRRTPSALEEIEDSSVPIDEIIGVATSRLRHCDEVDCFLV